MALRLWIDVSPASLLRHVNKGASSRIAAQVGARLLHLHDVDKVVPASLEQHPHFVIFQSRRA